MLLRDEQWVVVESITDTGIDEVVFNLRVAEYHAYFVGCAVWGFAVWAHNASCTVREIYETAQKAARQVGPGQARAIIRAVQAKHWEKVDAFFRAAGVDPAHPDVIAFKQRKGCVPGTPAAPEPTQPPPRQFNNNALSDDHLQHPKPGFTLVQEADGRWYTVTTSRQGEEVKFLAGGEYDFVSRGGVVTVERFMETGSTHTALAGHGPVDYAGRVYFGSSTSSRGVMRRWDNGSGHFMRGAGDSAAYAHQSGLPINVFDPIH